MADIYGSHFKYADKLSREYGLMIANAETKRFTQLAGTIKGVTIFNKTSGKRYLIDDDYSDSPVSFEVEIVTDNERCLTRDERREIEKWLFNRADYARFYIDVEDDPEGEMYEMIDGKEKRLYLKCRFINPTRIEYFGGIIGYKAMLEADSGYWWQESITKQFAVNNPNAASSSHIKIEVDTDRNGYVYPKVQFACGANTGNVELKNDRDLLHPMKFINIPGTSTVDVDGEINFVSPAYLTNLVGQNFLRLLDGENDIEITGCVSSITITFNNRRSL